MFARPLAAIGLLLVGMLVGCGTTALDAAAVVKLSAKEARRLTASADATLSLPKLRTLSKEAARELATYRKKSGKCTFMAKVPKQGEEPMEQTYTMVGCYTEDKTLLTKEGETKTVAVTKCRPVQVTRMITRLVQEERPHACPLTLQLDGLVSPKPDILAELAKHDGNLHLHGIKQLDADQAKSLAGHEGGVLALDGLDSLDPQTAEQLVSREGDLSLNGIRSLDPKVASVFAKHNGELSLDGVTDLSDDVADILNSHTSGPVSLKGVTNATDKAKEVIQSLTDRPFFRVAIVSEKPL